MNASRFTSVMSLTFVINPPCNLPLLMILIIIIDALCVYLEYCIKYEPGYGNRNDTLMADNVTIFVKDPS